MTSVPLLLTHGEKLKQFAIADNYAQYLYCAAWFLSCEDIY